LGKKKTKKELIEQIEREHKELAKWLLNKEKELGKAREMLVSVIGGTEAVMRIVRVESNIGYAGRVLKDGYWWLTHG